ncbi:MAG TPA: metal-dependent hydrolase [Gemmatimonadaceae bacterium]
MDNLTHSLVGAALAELTLPADAPRATRRTFFITGVVAANLPDADLVYTRITAAPLGSLLHHRGHTHTVAGIVLLGLAMAAVCALPSIRASVGAWRNRLGLLIALGLASHLCLDFWNSYGVHPFWPVTSRWFYGDAVYILEPWLWVLLGAAATMNTQNRLGRVWLGGFVAVLLALGTWMRVIPVPALVLLLVVTATFVALTRTFASRRRTVVAVVLSTVFVASVFGLREVARAEAAVAPPAGGFPRHIDFVLSSQAANPLCWSVLSIRSDEGLTAYAMTRGTAALIVRNACGTPRAQSVEWETPQIQSVVRLRDLYSGDCWVRAWLQFGRAPEIRDNVISDLRYSGPDRPNFTTMRIGPRPHGACPRNLTDWRPPRADLLYDLTP